MQEHNIQGHIPENKFVEYCSVHSMALQYNMCVTLPSLKCMYSTIALVVTPVMISHLGDDYHLPSLTF